LSLKLKDIVGNIFYTDQREKEAQAKKSAALQQTTNNVFGKTEQPTSSPLNPFLKKNGELFNPNLNYQQILNNPNVSQIAKKYISQATGLTPTVTTTQKQATVVPSTGNTYKATSNTIADAAQKYIGTPYVWGGESMSEGGMDCSGFVYNALKDAGYDVGRTTAQGYRSKGSTVSKADMQPGDLIFYGKNGEASHIGIYIGDGKMIHSSGGSKNTKANPGKGVTVANVDHRSDFIEARRY
jgi:cell wall-associated NlpC family hydrolase